jgi:hypothetical protein
VLDCELAGGGYNPTQHHPVLLYVDGFDAKTMGSGFEDRRWKREAAKPQFMLKYVDIYGMISMREQHPETSISLDGTSVSDGVGIFRLL